MKEQSITWLGHGSWKMVSPKGTVIYLDPWLEGNPACPISVKDTSDADIVCVTHGHSDHLGNAIEIVKNTGATLVTLPEVAAYCSLHGIPLDQNGGCLHMGGSIKIEDLCIRAVYALHASDIWGIEHAEQNKVMTGSGCCGMVIEPEDGKTVYFAGDTGLFSDMKIIGELYQPYVSVLPIGDKYVMGIREAAYAAQYLRSPYVIPGHYNTFPGIEADVNQFTKNIEVLAPKTEVKVLDPGMKFAI